MVAHALSLTVFSGSTRVGRVLGELVSHILWRVAAASDSYRLFSPVVWEGGKGSFSERRKADAIHAAVSVEERRGK